MREGIIKYHLEFRQQKISLPAQWQKLQRWRRTLVALKVLGQDPERYLGLGFGNISLRTAPKQFIITASQTGKLAELQAQHYTLVNNWQIAQNRIFAQGLLPPSSEALTHAQIYQLDPNIQAVFHGHSPQIWQKAQQHPQLFCFTSRHAEYGTPELAAEFLRLRHHKELKAGKIVILNGHEDGFISFGYSLQQAGQVIIDTLQKTTASLIKNAI